MCADGRMAERKRKSAGERKAQIVEEAIRLAGEIGPDRLTAEKLAREVGISQPGIFRHFPSKEAIWQAVARRIGELLRVHASLEGMEDLSPAVRLRGLILRHLAFIQATPAIPAILFSRELHAENEHLRAFFAQLMARRHELFAALIAAEVRAGRFHPGLDPGDAAYLLLALIQGLAMRWSLEARSFDLVEEGRRLLDLQLAGFSAQPPD